MMAHGFTAAHQGEHPVEQGHADQAQANHQHAGDGAAAEGDVERFIDALGGRLRCTHIGAHRHIHADEAAQAGQDGADGEADGRLGAQRKEQGDKQHDADNGNGFVLAGQVSGRPFLDGECNFLHSCVTGILFKDPGAPQETEDHGDGAAKENHIKNSTGCCHNVPLAFCVGDIQDSTKTEQNDTSG